MTVDIEIKNVKEVSNYISKVSRESTKAMGKALSKAAIYVQGEVKMSIAGQRAEKQSVDTGRFLNSVGIKQKGDDAEVYSDLSYAKFLEFGTSKTRARKHFMNTKNRSRNKIKEIFDTKISKGIKSVKPKDKIVGL